jgi:hypothetical protein
LKFYTVAEADVEIEVKELPPPGTIGVIVAGSLAKDEISAAVVKALIQEGLSFADIKVTVAAEVGVLPYITATVAKTVDVIIASGVVTHDPNGFHRFPFVGLLS